MVKNSVVAGLLKSVLQLIDQVYIFNRLLSFSLSWGQGTHPKHLCSKCLLAHCYTYQHFKDILFKIFRKNSLLHPCRKKHQSLAVVVLTASHLQLDPDPEKQQLERKSQGNFHSHRTLWFPPWHHLMAPPHGRESSFSTSCPQSFVSWFLPNCTHPPTMVFILCIPCSPTVLIFCCCSHQKRT